MKTIFALLLCFCCLSLEAKALPKLSAPEEVATAQEFFSFLAPVQKQVARWNAMVNREVPKHMRALRDNPSPLVVLSSILAALAYGVFHTLGPGHGKMVVATYFLTYGANFWRGVLMGSQVAVSHVAGAVLIVFLTDIAMRQMFTDPYAQTFWIRCLSYGLIIAVGLFMLAQAVLSMKNKRAAPTCCSCSHHQSKSTTFLSVGVGIVPCTGSLLILLYAMANNILWLGLTMVAFIAIGMAFTMTAIGWLCILGKKKFMDGRLGGGEGNFWTAALQATGALFITGLGSLMLLATLS